MIDKVTGLRRWRKIIGVGKRLQINKYTTAAARPMSTAMSTRPQDEVVQCDRQRSLK